MPDFEDAYAPDEPEWSPQPAPPDTWARWEPRVTQVFILHAFVIGVVVGMHTLGLIPRRTANVLLICQSPALLCAWLGLAVYVLARARERRDGVRSERSRMLVVGLDLITAIFAVIGVSFWLAILVL